MRQKAAGIKIGDPVRTLKESPNGAAQLKTIPSEFKADVHPGENAGVDWQIIRRPGSDDKRLGPLAMEAPEAFGQEAGARSDCANSSGLTAGHSGVCRGRCRLGRRQSPTRWPTHHVAHTIAPRLEPISPLMHLDSRNCPRVRPRKFVAKEPQRNTG